MLNFAVIGTFWLTDEFIKALNMSKNVCYYAQYSRKLERAKEYGIQRGVKFFYDSLDKLALDNNIDAVYIASPNMLHYSQAEQMLAAGKNVICEKPVTVTLAEYRELCEIADKQGVIYMEAMTNIHVPWAKELKNILSLSGRPVGARFDFCQRSSKLDKINEGKMFSSFDKNSCGGALMDLGVYATSLSSYLFGYPEKVLASASFSENGADVSDSVILKYNGFDCVITLSKLCESVARSEILLPDAVITLGNLSQLRNTCVHSNEKSKLVHGENSFPEAMIWEISDFVSYINGMKEEYLQNRKYTEMSIKLLEEIRHKIGYEIVSK